MTGRAWMIESLILVAGGGCALGLAGLMYVGYRIDRAAERQYPPQHAAGLPPIVVIRRPVADLDPDEDGRGVVTRRLVEPPPEPPAEPVEHHGADEDWSPTAELAALPPRPLDPEDPEALAAAEVHAELERIVRDALAAIARVGHAEQDTCAWTQDEIAAILGSAAVR